MLRLQSTLAPRADRCGSILQQNPEGSDVPGDAGRWLQALQEFSAVVDVSMVGAQTDLIFLCARQSRTTVSAEESSYPGGRF